MISSVHYMLHNVLDELSLVLPMTVAYQGEFKTTTYLRERIQLDYKKFS